MHFDDKYFTLKSINEIEYKHLRKLIFRILYNISFYIYLITISNIKKN